MQDILYHITIHALPARVYQVLTDPLGIGSWWSQPVMGPRHSAARGNGGGKVITTIEVDELTPPSHISWKVLTSNAPGDWSGTTISFDLVNRGGDTLLNFAHRGLPETNESYADIKAAWGDYMTSLKEYIESV